MPFPPHTPSILRRIGQLGFVVVMMCARFSAFGVPPNIEHNWSFPSENHDYGSSLVMIPEFGFVMAGHTYFPGSTRAHTYLRLCDFYGNELWYNNFEDTTTASSFRDLIASSSENSIVAAGGIASGGRLDVVNLNGEVQIQRQTIGNGFQTITSIACDASGNYLCSASRDFGLGTGMKGAVHRMRGNYALDTTWYYDDGNNSRVEFSDIVTNANGFVAVGSRDSYLPPFDEHAFIVVADSVGREIRKVALYTSDSSTHLNSICKISDSLYVIAGRIAYVERNLLLVAVDQYGNILWRKTFPYAPFEQLPRILCTANGDILVLCSDNFSEDQLVFLKCNSNGDSLWSLTYNLPNALVVIGGLAQRKDGGYVALCTITVAGSGDTWTQLISVSPDQRDSIAAAQKNPTPNSFVLGQNYPNPFNESTIIPLTVHNQGHAQLHLYNVLGQHTISVLNQELARGSYSIPLNGKSLSSGLYFYSLTLGDQTTTAKMVIQR